ncbi:MAG: Maf family protein [Ginsengibacter sp.]
MNKIILASRSPRRKHLLELAGILFEVFVSDADESFPKGLSIPEIPIYIAENKALAVRDLISKRERSGRTIISADTVVVLADRIIGKPASRDEAVSILSDLSGKIHRVITGVCILSDNEKNVFTEETEVEFYPLSVTQIEYYVDNFKPYDKAGAYAIQEWIGAIGVKSIKGDFYNVMGLPISRIFRELNSN